MITTLLSFVIGAVLLLLGLAISIRIVGWGFVGVLWVLHRVLVGPVDPTRYRS